MMTYKRRTKTLRIHTMASQTLTLDDLVIRIAQPADIASVARLAALDSAGLPAGRVLLAEVGGEAWAAVTVDGSSAIVADPFRPTAAIAGLLELRAAQLAGDDNTPSRPRAPQALAVQRAA